MVFLQRVARFIPLSLLLASGLSIPAVLADTVARTQGTCRLSDNGSVVFDGSCSVKQKQNQNESGGTVGFVVELENGKRYRFFGPNNQSLRLETNDGTGSNVLFEDRGQRGVFTWNDGRRTRRLVVRQGEVSTSLGDDRARIAELSERLGRSCRNAVAEKFSRASMANITVEQGATEKQAIDAGQITLRDIQKRGLSFNWKVKMSGKDPIGYCNVNADGSMGRFVVGN